MAWVYILRGTRRYYIGATENLERRMAEHKRGSNHTTLRFEGQIELVVAQELPSMGEARKLERTLKRKKIRGWQSQCCSPSVDGAAPKAFGDGSGFESRPTQLCKSRREFRGRSKRKTSKPAAAAAFQSRSGSSPT